MKKIKEYKLMKAFDEAVLSHLINDIIQNEKYEAEPFGSPSHYFEKVDGKKQKVFIQALVFYGSERYIPLKVSHAFIGKDKKGNPILLDKPKLKPST